MKRTKAAKAKKVKKPRKYNNSSRIEKSNENRQKIIENYINLLVEKRGDDISLEELAARSELSTRTLFRFFGDKKSLSIELEKHLGTFSDEISIGLKTLPIEEFAEFMFQIFDKYDKAILAYLYTNSGQESRTLLRKKFQVMIMDKIKSQISLQNSSANQSKIQLIATLISAKIWSDLRDNFSETNQEIGPSIKWAIGTLLKNLNA